MKFLQAIFNYVTLAAAGAVVAESTLAGDTGASKKQQVVDLVTNEAQVAGFAFPVVQKFLPSFVNLAVAGFNLVGLFQHKSA